MIPYNQNLKQRSRDLRKNMTDAERKLWSVIRMKQIHGLLFCRQKPIGKYIVDFYCSAAKLVIEVDGGQHFEAQNAGYDRRRDEFLKSQGLNVIRFTNLDVLKNIDGVVQAIIEKVGRLENPP
jgi:very-short-patch-repair endonuclease